MALWINQTLHINPMVSIDINERDVWIGARYSEDEIPGPAHLNPVTRAEANSMSIALRMAAKRLEEIGKGLE